MTFFFPPGTYRASRDPAGDDDLAQHQGESIGLLAAHGANHEIGALRTVDDRDDLGREPHVVTRREANQRIVVQAVSFSRILADRQ